MRLIGPLAEAIAARASRMCRSAAVESPRCASTKARTTRHQTPTHRPGVGIALRDAREGLRFVVSSVPRQQEPQAPRDVRLRELVVRPAQGLEAGSEHSLGGRVVAGHQFDLGDRDRVTRRRHPQAELLERQPRLLHEWPCLLELTTRCQQETERSAGRGMDVGRMERPGDVLDLGDRLVHREQLPPAA